VKNPDSVVLVDEAYVDFGTESATRLVKEFPNLLVTQTFSKSWALAGLRVGFAVGSPELIEGLNRVKDSFNSYPLDRLALAGAQAALEDLNYYRKLCQQIIDSRESLTRQLEDLGFQVLPSKANFVFVRTPDKLDAGALTAKLREKALLVRHFNKPRIDQYLRITLGTQEQNQKLVQILQNLLPA
jgi:histidinol-phosphate aminotransferase